jgi:hypothetical protein
MISEWDRQHMDEIMGGHGDWFGAQLIRLFAKADRDNFALLGLSFPSYAEAIQQWRDESDG